MSNTEQKAKNPPVTKVRVGGVTASIWENNGERGTSFNVSFDRRYRTTEGKYHSSTSYGAGDLLEIAKAADLAHTKILELYAANAASAQPESEDIPY